MVSKQPITQEQRAEPKTPGDACGICYFFWRIDISPTGYCKRRPPSVVLSAGGLATSPVVADSDWCGEFQTGPAGP